MTIELKKKRADLVDEMGKLDAWLSDYVGHLKKCKTEKESSNIHKQRNEKVNRKVEIQSELRRIKVQIQEETERRKEEEALNKLKEMESHISDNEYLRLILEELREIKHELKK